MSFDFAGAAGITIPEGVVKKITRKADGAVVWEKPILVPALNKCTWETIKEVSVSGRAAKCWSVGDEINITVSGTTYAAVIIGFDHDIPDNISNYGRDKAGITFQLQHSLSTIYPACEYDNYNGWNACSLRTSTLSSLLSKLNSDLKSVIVPVKKTSGIGSKGTSTVITADSLFLLSENEIYGNVTYSVDGEGTQYEYYANGGSKRKKRSSSYYSWWTRSAAKTGSTYWVGVTSSGGVQRTSCTSNSGVSFAFCV